MKYKKKVWFVLPMRCLLFLAVFCFCSIITGRSLTEITHWWSVIASIINVVTIVVLLVICRCEGTTYLEMIRFERKQGNILEKSRIMAAVYLIVIMLLMGMGGMYMAGWLCYGEFPYLAPMMIAPVHPCFAILNVLILPVTTTLAEDGVYLGYGVNFFDSKWAAVFIPAFFYALQHSFIPAIFDARFMLYRFLSFLPLTIWICFKYYRGSSVAYIMAGHWVLNMATAVQIVITSLNPEAYAVLIKR